MIKRIGYACINTELSSSNCKINRKMIKKTFKERGIVGASQLALLNIRDLVKIMEWNVKNNIHMYRMSSSMFPWSSEYEFQDLPDFKEIEKTLKSIGKIANDNDIRVTFHPGHFTILSSSKPHVIKAAIKDLNQHAQIMDMMDLPKSQYSKINIHIGGARLGKVEAMDRFCEGFNQLSSSAKSRLTIENDDRQSLFDVEDLLYVNGKVGTPIVFDYHHYDCHPGNLTKKEAFELAISTWPDDITPAVHFSSSKRKFEDGTSKVVAHADYIYNKINDYGYDIDVMCEAKAKEAAVLEYLKYGAKKLQVL